MTTISASANVRINNLHEENHEEFSNVASTVVWTDICVLATCKSSGAAGVGVLADLKTKLGNEFVVSTQEFDDDSLLRTLAWTLLDTANSAALSLSLAANASAADVLQACANRFACTITVLSLSYKAKTAVRYRVTPSASAAHHVYIGHVASDAACEFVGLTTAFDLDSSDAMAAAPLPPAAGADLDPELLVNLSISQKLEQWAKSGSDKANGDVLVDELLASGELDVDIGSLGEHEHAICSLAEAGCSGAVVLLSQVAVVRTKTTALASLAAGNAAAAAQAALCGLRRHVVLLHISLLLTPSVDCDELLKLVSACTGAVDVVSLIGADFTSVVGVRAVVPNTVSLTPTAPQFELPWRSPVLDAVAMIWWTVVHRRTALSDGLATKLNNIVHTSHVWCRVDGATALLLMQLLAAISIESARVPLAVNKQAMREFSNRLRLVLMRYKPPMLNRVNDPVTVDSISQLGALPWCTCAQCRRGDFCARSKEFVDSGKKLK
jgi:hypothetical protein